MLIILSDHQYFPRRAINTNNRLSVHSVHSCPNFKQSSSPASPYWLKAEQTLSSLELGDPSSPSPTPPFLLPPVPRRSLFPLRPRDSLCFDHSQMELDNLSATLHSPRPRGAKQGLLLSLLFASSSDVLKKTILR